MTFKDLTHVYLEKVHRLSYYDDIEWDSWKNAYYAEVGNPENIFTSYLKSKALRGIAFEKVCKEDHLKYIDVLEPETLWPTVTFI